MGTCVGRLVHPPTVARLRPLGYNIGVINIHDEKVRSTIGKALGKIPSGVFILLAEHDGKTGAMMASWVQQAGFVPPTILVGIGKGRPITPIVQGAGRFTLSVVGADDHALMKKYARGIPDGVDPLEGVAVARTTGGAVYLAESLAHLECKLVKTIDPGADHDLLVAEVSDGIVLKEGAPFVHLRGNGFHY
jgi:3-hydroxy-9,10-secoandrosta-1,3,5(10)-triene-9,17-dione monooxygenase reductase component